MIGSLAARTPKRGEVRQHNGRTYYVQGPSDPPEDGPAGMVFRYTEPMTDLVEVEGVWTGHKLRVATAQVEKWEVVSS